MIKIIEQYAHMKYCPALASKDLEFNILEGQREEKKKHTLKLTGFIHRNNIRPFNVSFAIVKVTKAELSQCGFVSQQFIEDLLAKHPKAKDTDIIEFKVMVNGQHSALAVIKAGMNEIPVCGTVYECTTLQDVITVYAYYDGDNLIKNLDDYLWLAIKLIVYSGGDISTNKPNRLNPFQRIPSLFAIKAMIRINKQTSLSKSEKTRLVPNFLPQLIDINNLLIGTNGLQANLSYLRVIEIILRSYLEDREVSIRFWKEVKDNIGKDNSIVRKFRAYYDLIQWRGGKPQFKSTTPFDIRIFEAMMYMAWSHYKKGTNGPKDFGKEHDIMFRTDIQKLKIFSRK